MRFVYDERVNLGRVDITTGHNIGVLFKCVPLFYDAVERLILLSPEIKSGLNYRGSYEAIKSIENMVKTMRYRIVTENVHKNYEARCYEVYFGAFIYRIWFEYDHPQHYFTINVLERNLNQLYRALPELNKYLGQLNTMTADYKIKLKEARA